MKTKQQEPYIWLQEGESEGKAKCGCVLTDEGQPAYFQCVLHDAAHDLREALGLIVDVWDHHGILTDEHEKITRMALARADGRKQS